jgi:acyl carrier protein
MDSLILSAVAESLDCDPATIDLNTCFRNHESWDSLASLTLISILQEKVSPNISFDSLAKCTTVSDISRLASNA